MLAAAKGVDRLDRVGDVLEEPENGRRPPLGVLLADAAADHMPQGAVRADEAKLEVEACPRLHCRDDVTPDQLAVLRVVEGDRVVDIGIEGLPIDPVDIVHRVRPGDGAGGQVQAPMADAGHGLGDLEQALLFAGLPVGLGQFEFVNHDPRQQPQPLQRRVVGPGAWPVVEDAQRSQVMAVLGGQGGAGVEAQVGRARDQGIVDEARVGRGVLDHHDGLRPQLYGVTAKGLVARRFGGFDTHPGLEPQALLVDEGDHGDRGVEQVRGQASQSVDRRVRLGVQDAEGPQGVQPERLAIAHVSPRPSFFRPYGGDAAKRLTPCVADWRRLRRPWCSPFGSIPGRWP